MKLGSLLILASLAPALLCHAQDQAPAAQPAAQDAAKPVAPETATPVAPQTATPPAPATAALAVPDTYVIGATDVIAVTVFKEPALSGSMLVRPDGMISIPLLGDVQASGKTPEQLAEDVTAKLKRFVQDPNVTVVVGQINSKKVFLMGDGIGRGGPLALTPGMTLLEAIATAGGLSQFANSKKMYILRSEDGKLLKIPVQYKQALKGDASLNLTLKPGDTIVVP
jgi:polysaccharide export outer membrane protein